MIQMSEIFIRASEISPKRQHCFMCNCGHENFGTEMSGCKRAPEVISAVVNFARR